MTDASTMMDHIHIAFLQGWLAIYAYKAGHHILCSIFGALAALSLLVALMTQTQ